MSIVRPLKLCFFLAIGFASSTHVFGQASVVTGSVSTSKTSYTVGLGKNRLIVVAVTGEAGTIGTITSITWGGQSLTQARTQANGTAFRTDIWYLNEAGISAARSSCSYNFVVNWSAAPTTEIFAAMTLKDVDQTTPVAASNSATSASATNLATGNIAVGINDLVVYASSSSQNKTHTAPAGYTEQSDQIVGGTASMATATKSITVAGTESPSATWSGGAGPLINNGVAFNGVASTGIVTYYSRNATSGGNWDDANSWTLNANGSGGPLSSGVWPTRSDHVVILAGHTITINATDDNKQCGVSPDGLARSNIGAGGGAGFNGSNLAMFYQTGDITINGTLTVTGGINMMVEGYTHITSTGSFTLTSYLVNIGYLEADASSTLTTLDDLSITGNSITIINTNSTTADDLNIDFTDAFLCGTGTSTLLNSGGSAINYTNSATVNQICTTFVVNCSGGGCSGFPVTGTGTSSGNRGPGGVESTNGTTNLTMWFRAETISQSDNTNVSSWLDQSGYNNHANAVSGNEPVFRTNIQNGNPTVRFVSGNTDYLRVTNASSLRPNTISIFLVGMYNASSSAWSPFLIKADNYNWTNGYAITRDNANNSIRSYVTQWDANFVNSALATSTYTIISSIYNKVNIQTYYNETSQGTDAFTANITNSNNFLYLGISPNTAGTGVQQPLNGDIAEVALYDRNVTAAERIIIHNYLAAKYNLTLGSNDLYTMDNAGNGNFDFEVAGIGQASDGTNHKDAQGTGLVRMVIQSPSSLDNSEFLFWGHNNGLLTSNLIDVDGTVIKERITRIWRVSETGDVGNVALSFDISSLTGSPLGPNLRLLIDRDGDGFADNDVTPIGGGTFSGDIITFTGVNLQNGDRFTLGNTDLSNPLPVELVSFTAEAKEAEVHLRWTTASELSNDYFTVQRSPDAERWEEVTRVEGAGTTADKHDYETVDGLPYTGVSYYRLKQTDLDGRFTYSSVQRVEIRDPYYLKVYPNPSSGTFTVATGFDLEPGNVRLMNMLGQEIPVQFISNGSSNTLQPQVIAPGVYILQIQKGYWSRSVRLMIE